MCPPPTWCVGINTGIGGGYICNNKLIRGSRGGVGEIGHTVLSPMVAPLELHRSTSLMGIDVLVANEVVLRVYIAERRSLWLVCVYSSSGQHYQEKIGSTESLEGESCSDLFEASSLRQKQSRICQSRMSWPPSASSSWMPMPLSKQPKKETHWRWMSLPLQQRQLRLVASIFTKLLTQKYVLEGKKRKCRLSFSMEVWHVQGTFFTTTSIFLWTSTTATRRSTAIFL